MVIKLLIGIPCVILSGLYFITAFLEPRELLNAPWMAILFCFGLGLIFSWLSEKYD
jgi:hypothetical protein